MVDLSIAMLNYQRVLQYSLNDSECLSWEFGSASALMLKHRPSCYYPLVIWHGYWTSAFLIGKSSMHVPFFHGKLLVYWRVVPIYITLLVGSIPNKIAIKSNSISWNNMKYLKSPHTIHKNHHSIPWNPCFFMKPWTGPLKRRTSQRRQGGSLTKKCEDVAAPRWRFEGMRQSKFRATGT